jgi:uncharacterized surface protein with fasciclin (FAS1) repeats
VNKNLSFRFCYEKIKQKFFFQATFFFKPSLYKLSLKLFLSYTKYNHMRLKFLLLVFMMSIVRMVHGQTVVDIIVNSPDHEILETAVIAAGLDGALSGEGPFTVFAPTDDAFNALPAGTIEALLNDIPTLTSILTYHVAGVNALSTDLTDGQEVVTLNGESVTVTINADGVFINDAQVTVADLVAENGVVHVIDAVLLPPAESNTVVDIIVNSPDHEILETAVVAAGLAGALSGEGPFTVFAPTDAAFNALPAGTIEALLNDIPTLTSILTYHVAGVNALSTDLTNGQEVVTLNGESVTVTINADGVFINDAQVTVADLVADNGVVHVIDAVLLPPAESNTVVDIIVNSPDHEILETAVVAAGLAGALSGEGPFTVFAPTDAAFNALPAGTIEALLNDIPTLTSILTYHVAGVNALSTDLTNGQEVVTLNGESVTVTINADGVFINDARVTVADLVADNGVVHVIDAVLLPPARTTVVDVIVNSPDHTILETAVVAAGLAGALSGEGPFTVFAPTDAAFNALPAGTIEALLNDIPTLTSILTYHVAGANVLSTDLYDGREILTLNGKVVQVRITPDGVFINDARVTVADITTDNGVVHVIDAILLPSSGTSVFDIIAGSDVHNTLETAIRTAELVTALSNQDDIFTVFAPTDAAFAALPAGVLDTVLANKTLLRDILAYHVVNDEIDASFLEILDGAYIQMFNNKTVTIKVNDDGIFINDIKITVVDLFADNGIVHVIDAVMLAPDSTIIDVVRNSPVHTILENLLDEAEFSDPLEGYGPFTLFAPTDAAIQALPAEVIQALSEDIGLLEDVLAYHLVQGTALSTDLSNGLTVPTLLGKNVTVTINNDGVFINDAKVILADIRTDNGVVHVLDAVLLPKTTVVDILGERDELSTARLLVNLSGLEAALNGDGPFTVFAPDDNAFDTAPLSLLEYATSSQANLQNVLLFHTVPGRALSTDLSNGQSLVTANGKTLLVTINNNGVFINNAQVIEADLVAENGVVHIIDEVLDILTSLDDIIENKVSIYPNPTADFLRINHTYSSDAVYFITDMQNRIVRQGKVQETEQIDVRDIQSGQYQLLIQDGRKVSSGKFVKVF